MRKHTAAVVSALAIAPLMVASPAAAEPAPTAPTATATRAAAPTQTFVMPSVTNGTLAKALDTITAISPTAPFRINITQMGGESTHIQSPGSWVVCRQSPADGSSIKSNARITLRVERPWYGC